MYLKNKKHRRSAPSRRKGASVLELALTSPLLLLLLLGTIDAGQFGNCYQTVSNASREGARVAARSTTVSVTTVEDSVMAYMYDAFPGVSPGVLDSATTVEVRDENGTVLTGFGPAGVPTGQGIWVDVSLQFDAVRYIPGLDELDNRMIDVSTMMRRE